MKTNLIEILSLPLNKKPLKVLELLYKVDPKPEDISGESDLELPGSCSEANIQTQIENKTYTPVTTLAGLMKYEKRSLVDSLAIATVAL